MRVTVISIEDDSAVLVTGTSALGVRGTFGCPAVVGEAIFVASRGFEDNLRTGSTIEVETGYESITDVEILAAHGIAESIEPCGEAADYLVRGSVVSVVPGGRVKVRVRGFSFDLDREHIDQLLPKIGDVLQFKIQRLSLWDRGGT